MTLQIKNICPAVETMFAIEIQIYLFQYVPNIPIYTAGTLVYPTLTLMVKMVKWQRQNV